MTGSLEWGTITSDAVRLLDLGVDLRQLSGMNVRSVHDIFFERENDGDSDEAAAEVDEDRESESGEEVTDDEREELDDAAASVALFRWSREL